MTVFFFELTGDLDLNKLAEIAKNADLKPNKKLMRGAANLKMAASKISTAIKGSSLVESTICSDLADMVKNLEEKEELYRRQAWRYVKKTK